MSDIVERLRMYHESLWAIEAADEIERLRTALTAAKMIDEEQQQRIEELENEIERNRGWVTGADDEDS